MLKWERVGSETGRISWDQLMKVLYALGDMWPHVLGTFSTTPAGLAS